jgi:hypothetical protein
MKPIDPSDADDRGATTNEESKASTYETNKTLSSEGNDGENAKTTDSLTQGLRKAKWMLIKPLKTRNKPQLLIWKLKLLLLPAGSDLRLQENRNHRKFLPNWNSMTLRNSARS